jgi:hypothetical protein
MLNCRLDHTLLAILAVCSILATVPASAAPPTVEARFVDIAQDPTSGLAWSRTPSLTDAIWDQLKLQVPFTPAELVVSPTRTKGQPGVALLDVDGDGDLDIYVTNGPGTANSLFVNRWIPDGVLAFDDQGAARGAGAADQSSNGVCFGDVDNDGDPDLYVLGENEPNRLLVNRGDGTFDDATAAAGVGGGSWGSTSCAVGDLTGDGLVDLVVANAFDFRILTAIHVEPFAANHPNQLFVNRGDGTFEDASESSGLRDLTGLPAWAGPQPATITWAVAVVDLDLDGDLDIVFGDDQGGISPAIYGGVDRGYLRYLSNDGAGTFTDRTLDVGLDAWGSWMGLSFGDFDCDGHLDLFGSNFGDYAMSALEFVPNALGDQTSRWFLAQGDGTFGDQGVGDLVATPFGWGTSAADYDLDGDTDILFHGGLDLSFLVVADNPGVLLENRGCTADFSWNQAAFSASTDHLRRTVQGVASGDLDLDGDVDVVSASNFDLAPSIPLVPYPVTYGSPFDAVARFVPTFTPLVPGQPVFAWAGHELSPGSLAVEINRAADDGARGVSLIPVGTAGLLPGGRSSRDGLGAVISFQPLGGPRATQPVLGGGSYLSQKSTTAHFGLGRAPLGTVEVRWPGGTVNRLHGVRAGERLVLPEIPCDADAPGTSRAAYRACLRDAVDTLEAAGVIDRRHGQRLIASALGARGRN